MCCWSGAASTLTRELGPCRAAFCSTSKRTSPPRPGENSRRRPPWRPRRCLLSTWASTVLRTGIRGDAWCPSPSWRSNPVSPNRPPEPTPPVPSGSRWTGCSAAAWTSPSTTCGSSSTAARGTLPSPSPLPSVPAHRAPAGLRGGVGDTPPPPQLLPQGPEDQRLHRGRRSGPQRCDREARPAVQSGSAAGPESADGPAGLTVELEGIRTMSDIPIVVLTALDVEYEAVRRLLERPQPHTHPQGTRFEVGLLAGGRARIALGLVGKGNQPAAVLAERAVNEFSPAALLFVGVAGALHSDIAIGDVVVATHIYAFHGGTSEDDGFKSRPRVWEVSHS